MVIVLALLALSFSIKTYWLAGLCKMYPHRPTCSKQAYDTRMFVICKIRHALHLHNGNGVYEQCDKFTYQLNRLGENSRKTL